MKITTKTSTTQNPKTLTGTENMKATTKEILLNHVETFIMSERRAARREAANIIWEMVLQIERILDSETAQQIYNNCYGKKFDRMNTLRKSLRSKDYLLINLWDKIMGYPNEM